MTWPECVGTQECHFAVLQSIILLLYSVLSIQDQGCIEVCWSANERNIAGTEKLQLLVPVKLLRLRPEMTVESFWRCCNEQMSPLWVFFAPSPLLRVMSWLHPYLGPLWTKSNARWVGYLCHWSSTTEYKTPMVYPPPKWLVFCLVGH